MSDNKRTLTVNYVSLTERAKEELNRLNESALIVRLRYKSGPCEDDWCPLVPEVLVEPFAGTPPSQYVPANGDTHVFFFDKVYKSMELENNGIVVDYIKGHFTLKGAVFRL
ncbi:MAG: hypothetical protein JRN26_05985 [Nitrososphaerota archaeon]|jgi:hypothetical protein|nr:hypothetical protein [Nitrososphaerota archaeon]MDG6926997.1 hypothetical protein [Nitrososphaerota archaeon]MDG6930442.1 hypothetical protein [Nitrososphaerota archaeon]MDG6931483.1 hypothetical protein [Nitrososphaerota archaeon]MDG6936412.1 hypothetical protein [Nitrososphaerota archaeon]